MIHSFVLSIETAVIATILVMTAGLPLAYLFARYSFKGKLIMETVFSLPLILPPSVVGYVLLVLLGQDGLGRLGIHWIFTWKAAVLAGAIVSFPLFFRTAKASFENLDENIIDAARLDGTMIKIFFKVSLPLAKHGLTAASLLAFLRAIGEFGATLMIAGNIPGVTQTAPLAIYDHVLLGDEKAALLLSLLLILFSFILLSISALLAKKSS
ncbi:molybdate ABC transporter permease subunit [Fictibacillus nanhaiensis]|uniref:molybdate ABC transporter permease subunit n=1 Tax=Fictibacillus nanhaiensis TaxID=742169 RepID=UPI001C93A21C|nr:molybdate ABC transporter permease subunit [Fictibacillus nanhaiensis]MBY6035378.1 molybdate ABC transporter permease subunit [Fictibacillus nanhaiensis]